MGLAIYQPSVDDDAALFRDTMRPTHQASDPAVRRHNADRRERQHIADGSEGSIFKSAFED